MKIHKSFFDIWLRPLTEQHREYVQNMYPHARFLDGYIFDGLKQLTKKRLDRDGEEAEYYAWLWAYENIGVEMLRKLES